MNNNTKLYRFVLVLSGLSSLDEHIEDALFEAGCDDALLIFRDNVPDLEFDRAAISLEKAIYAAITDVESANIGARVLRVEITIRQRIDQHLAPITDEQELDNLLISAIR